MRRGVAPRRAACYNENMIKCVIFDMDGTLGNTMPICIEGIRGAVQKATGKRLDDEQVLKYFGASEEGIIGKLMPEHKQEGIDLYLEFYRKQHLLTAPCPFEGIVPLLRALNEKGVYCAIVSGKGEKSLNISLEVMGIDKYFCKKEHGDEQATGKDVFIAKVLSELNVDKSRAVYVGDAVSDVRASRKAGVAVIAAAWAESADKSALRAAAPDFLAESVQAAQAWLEERIN